MEFGSIYGYAIGCEILVGHSDLENWADGAIVPLDLKPWSHVVSCRQSVAERHCNLLSWSLMELGNAVNETRRTAQQTEIAAQGNTCSNFTGTHCSIDRQMVDRHAPLVCGVYTDRVPVQA